MDAVLLRTLNHRAGDRFDPDAAARKLTEIACSIEAVQDDRIHIEKINWPFLCDFRGSRTNMEPGLTAPLRTAGYGCTKAVRFTQTETDLFA